MDLALWNTRHRYNVIEARSTTIFFVTLPYLASYADFSLSQKCAQSDGKVMEK